MRQAKVAKMGTRPAIGGGMASIAARAEAERRAREGEGKVLSGARPKGVGEETSAQDQPNTSGGAHRAGMGGGAPPAGPSGARAGPPTGMGGDAGSPAGGLKRHREGGPSTPAGVACTAGGPSAGCTAGGAGAVGTVGKPDHVAGAVAARKPAPSFRPKVKTARTSAAAARAAAVSKLHPLLRNAEAGGGEGAGGGGEAGGA
jgi:hypothetical protein